MPPIWRLSIRYFPCKQAPQIPDESPSRRGAHLAAGHRYRAAYQGLPCGIETIGFALFGLNYDTRAKGGLSQAVHALEKHNSITFAFLKHNRMNSQPLNLRVKFIETGLDFVRFQHGDSNRKGGGETSSATAGTGLSGTGARARRKRVHQWRNCRNASKRAIPTVVARFRLRTLALSIGTFTTSPGWEARSSSGRPLVSEPKTRQSPDLKEKS